VKETQVELLVNDTDFHGVCQNLKLMKETLTDYLQI